MTELQNKATNNLVGKKALLINVGEDPVEVIVSKIDVASGLIIEVIIKDENLEKRVLDVKDKVVVVLPWAIRFVLQIIGWIKSRKKEEKK